MLITANAFLYETIVCATETIVDVHLKTKTIVLVEKRKGI